MKSDKEEDNGCLGCIFDLVGIAFVIWLLSLVLPFVGNCLLALLAFIVYLFS